MSERTMGTYCVAGNDRRAGMLAKIQVLCTHEEMAEALAEIAGRYAALRSPMEPTDGAKILARAMIILETRHA